MSRLFSGGNMCLSRSSSILPCCGNCPVFCLIALCTLFMMVGMILPVTSRVIESSNVSELVALNS